MRAKDIQVGGRYYTYVGQQRVLVEVIQDRGGSGRRYLVKRVDNGRVLVNKLRAPSALHPTGEGYWPGMTEEQERLSGLGRCGPNTSCVGPKAFMRGRR